MSDFPDNSVTCDRCGSSTFEFERFCHRCGFDRWEDTDDKEQATLQLTEDDIQRALEGEPVAFQYVVEGVRFEVTAGLPKEAADGE